MNLIDYINSTEEPSAGKLVAVRQRIVMLLKTIAPDLNIEENAVLQELLLNNFARIIALAEEAQNAELSDIQLSNIINGNICDCEFAEAFVKSLGIESLTTANTFGVLRIKFSADAINANSQFLEKGIYLKAGTSIGFDDTYMFRFYLCHSGALTIEFPKANCTFKQFSPANFLEKNTFYAYIEDVVSNDDTGLNNKDFFRPYVYTVDLPIYGPADASLSAGDIAATDIDSNLLDNYITSIELVQDIEPIDLPTNIIDLALLAKRIYPNPKANTKPGIISYFSRYMPFIECISPETVSSNDKPVLNVYAKKGLDPITVTQIIPRSYTGLVPLASFPKEFIEASYRRRIKTSDDLITTLATAEYEDKVLTIGSDYKKDFIDLTCINYGKADTTLDPVESFNAASDIFMTPNIYLYNEDTSKYDILDFTQEDQFKFNYITITYTYDPALLFLRNLRNNPYINKNFDIRIKSYIDMHMDRIDIVYEQKVGTYFDRQNAKQELFSYINTCSYPIKPFDQNKLRDILLENGATNVTDVYFYGAERLYPYTAFISYNPNKILAGKVQTPSINSALETNEGKNYVLENSMPITNYNIAYSIRNEDAFDLDEIHIA